MFSAVGLKAGMLDSRDPRRLVRRLNHQARRHDYEDETLVAEGGLGAIAAAQRATKRRHGLTLKTRREREEEWWWR